MNIIKIDSKNAEILYKSFPFELTKDSTEDEEYFYFEGYASVFNNIDRGGDKILPGAFTETIRIIPVKILWQHQMSEPIGIPVIMQEDEKGLFVKGKLPKSDFLVSGRVIPQMKVGSVRELSIGYSIREYYTEKTEDGYIWNITKVDLYEFSPVSVPMNTEAIITDMKQVSRFKNIPIADRDQKWNRKTAIKNIMEHTGSEAKPSRAYRNYFMWFDQDDADNFGAYKLPYADWIDGQFMAVPRALIAIKSAIGGARGGIDIPEEDKVKILSHVDRYLSKLDDAEKCFIFADVKDIESREDLNELFKEIGLFSKHAREKICSLLPSRSNSVDEEEYFKTISKQIRKLVTEKKNG